MAKKSPKGFSWEHFDLNPGVKPKGKNYLLVIGIDKYEHFNQLNNAVRDAQTFKSILLERYQFKPETTFELFDEKATRKNILNKLVELESLVTEDDNFVLYFSGHGMMNQRKTKGFWVPVDAESDSEVDYLPNSRIKDQLDEIHAHHIYLIVDSCFSGSFVSRSDEFTQRVGAFPSRRVLTSGRNEVVSDGKIGQHSPFANCLVSYLKIHQGPLVVSDLEQHIKKYTPKSAKQTPSNAIIFGLGDQGGEFVFYPKRNEENDWVMTSSLNSIDAYKFYLSAYPHGKQREEAIKRLKKLEQENSATSVFQAIPQNIKIEEEYVNEKPSEDIEEEVPLNMVDLRNNVLEITQKGGNDERKISIKQLSEIDFIK